MVAAGESGLRQGCVVGALGFRALIDEVLVPSLGLMQVAEEELDPASLSRAKTCPASVRGSG